MVGINQIQIDWINKLKKNATDIKSNLPFPIKHEPPSYTYGKPDVKDFYLKKVMVLVLHRNYPGMSILCPECKRPVSNKGWVSHPPARYIHDMSSGIYLVQYQYECKNSMSNSKVIPLSNLLDSLPSFVRAQLPIVLTNSSGMTREYLIYLTSDATTGKSLMEIGTLIATMRTNRYLESRVAYTSARDNYNELVRSGQIINTNNITRYFNTGSTLSLSNNTNNNVSTLSSQSPLFICYDNVTIYTSIPTIYPEQIMQFHVAEAQKCTAYNDFENSLFKYLTTLPNVKTLTGNNINWTAFTTKYNYLIRLNKKIEDSLDIYLRTNEMLKNKRKVVNRNNR